LSFTSADFLPRAAIARLTRIRVEDPDRVLRAAKLRKRRNLDVEQALGMAAKIAARDMDWLSRHLPNSRQTGARFQTT